MRFGPARFLGYRSSERRYRRQGRSIVLASIAMVTVFGGGQAHAGTITETFTFGQLSGASSEDGTPFSSFDPALGTLTSVAYSITATANFSGGQPYSGDEAVYFLNFSGPGQSIPEYLFPIYSGNDAPASRTLTPAALTGANISGFIASSGTITPDISVENLSDPGVSVSYSTFGTESVTYTYTPATSGSAPEPSSLALIAAGLCGLGLVGRRYRIRRRSVSGGNTFPPPNIPVPGAS